MRIIIIAICLVLLSLSNVFAVPSVTGVSGTVTSGQSITISGSSFGTKTTAAPVKWDTFENGTVGQELTTQGYSEYGSGTSQVYSTGNKHGGSKAAYYNVSGENFTGAVLNSLSLDEMFLSLWVRWDNTSGQTNVTKWIRFGTGTGPDYYHTVPHVWFSGIPMSGWQVTGVVHEDDNTSEFQSDMSTLIPEATWSRMDIYFKHSTGGNSATNGVFKVFVDQVQSVSRTNFATRHTDSNKVNNIILPFLQDICEISPCVMNVYFDDLYVDSTYSRVEICTGPTWAARGTCEVQPPSSWAVTGDEIIATVNQGAFSSSASAYLYVVDNTGAGNTNGYGVTFGSGGGGDTTPPTLQTSTIDSTGTTITLSFSEVVSQGSGYNNSHWDVDCNTMGNNITMTYSSGNGTVTHIYTLGSVVKRLEVCNIDFSGTANSEEDGAGNDLAAIASASITNNSNIDTAVIQGCTLSGITR